MKIPLIALILLAVGCSTSRLGKVTVVPQPAPTTPHQLTERVRIPEFVSAYHVARYVDPNHPLLMHEAHSVYRVEGQAAWNLHSPPGYFALPSGAGVLTNVAYQPPQINDAVVAELNHQRTVTRNVMQQAETLNDSLREFAAALSNTRILAEQNRELREQINITVRRLEALEAKLSYGSEAPPEFMEEHEN